MTDALKIGDKPGQGKGDALSNYPELIGVNGVVLGKQDVWSHSA